MEKWDELWPDGYCYHWDDTLFPPSTDSFVLGSFATLRRRERVCDLGSGCGLLGLLLLAREGSVHVTNVERCAEACALAQRNAACNGLQTQMVTVCADLRDTLPPANSFDLVVSNPPYFSTGSGEISTLRGDARSEVTCTLEDVCVAAARLLRWGGRFALVFRPERLVELLLLLRRCGLEPKRLQFVQHSADAAPRLLLLESRRGGHAGLTVEPPLLLHQPDGSETAAYRRIYFREKR